MASAQAVRTDVEIDDVVKVEMRGINRSDEGSFDSGDFPKVIFASQVESSDDRCGQCHEPLIGD